MGQDRFNDIWDCARFSCDPVLVDPPLDLCRGYLFRIKVEHLQAERFKKDVFAANSPAWSIVIVGAWNQRIFTPRWMGGGRLTASKEIEIAAALDDPGAPRVFGFDDIQIEVHSSRISLKVKQPEDVLLLRIRSIAIKLLTELAHTPVAAVGTNFSFVDDEPSANITRLFDLKDNGRLAENELSVQTTTIKRQLRRGESELNFSMLLQKDGKVYYDFNFHANTPDTAAAVAELNADIISRKTEVQHLLSQIYYPQ